MHCIEEDVGVDSGCIAFSCGGSKPILGSLFDDG